MRGSRARSAPSFVPSTNIHMTNEPPWNSRRARLAWPGELRAIAWMASGLGRALRDFVRPALGATI
eukprot:8287953-Alexandrium_andersonii.AAC.1